jgi:hypothetical protein
MSNFFKPIAALLVGCAIIGAIATGIAIPIGLLFG